MIIVGDRAHLRYYALLIESIQILRRGVGSNGLMLVQINVWLWLLEWREGYFLVQKCYIPVSRSVTW
jgi:hypothetical protein